MEKKKTYGLVSAGGAWLRAAAEREGQRPAETWSPRGARAGGPGSSNRVAAPMTTITWCKHKAFGTPDFYFTALMIAHSSEKAAAKKKEVVLPGAGWGRAAHLGKRAPARASSWEPFCQSLTRLRRSDMMAVRSMFFLS